MIGKLLLLQQHDFNNLFDNTPESTLFYFQFDMLWTALQRNIG